MNRREAITEALYDWRIAERDLADATDGIGDRLRADIEHYRSKYQRLSSDSMVNKIHQLKEAEHRRSNATPSTPSFHQAAKDTQVIAADIWESARQSDRDTPQREGNAER